MRKILRHLFLGGALIECRDYFKTLNNRPWGANNESLGGPGGPGTGFCSPGGGFSGSRRSGKPLRLLRLKKTPLGLQKTVPGPPGPPGGLVISPRGRLLAILKYFLLVLLVFTGFTSSKTDFLKVFIKFKDSRHAQMPIYVVFHEEFDFQVKNSQF